MKDSLRFGLGSGEEGTSFEEQAAALRAAGKEKEKKGGAIAVEGRMCEVVIAYARATSIEFDHGTKPEDLIDATVTIVSKFLASVATSWADRDRREAFVAAMSDEVETRAQHLLGNLDRNSSGRPS